MTNLLLFTVLLAAGPQVTVNKVDDEVLAGDLVGLDESAVRVAVEGGGPRDVPLAEVRSLQFTGIEAPSPHDDPPAVEVTLVDGSRLAGTAAVVAKQSATITTEGLGDIPIPLVQLRSLRLGNVEGVENRWAEIQSRDNKADLLVVRKENLLDFVEGSVGEVGVESVSFLLEGRTVSVPRAKAFGVLFAAKGAEPARTTIQLHAGRTVLQLAKLTYDGRAWAARTQSGLSVSVPIEKVHLIEFEGRLRYLHEMEAAVEYPAGVTELDHIWQFRKGTASSGAALKIGADEVVTRRGLWIHSGVTVRYRINRDYRRLTGLAGMDHNVAGDKSVRLVILGDGKPLLDRTIAWSEPAEELDLDVSGVRDLEIRVERLPEIAAQDIFGMREHLDLGNIRLIR